LTQKFIVIHTESLLLSQIVIGVHYVMSNFCV